MESHPMTTVIRIAALTLVLATASAPSFALMIRGSQGCAEWTRERKAAKAPFDKPWLLGYLSGLASGMNREFWGGGNTGMARIETATVYARIDQFCAANPERNIVHAADHLFKERTGLSDEGRK